MAAWPEERFGLAVRSTLVVAGLTGLGRDQLEQGLAKVFVDGDSTALFPPVAGV